MFRHSLEEPAGYWSAPREHLSPIEQMIAYRGLSPEAVQNAIVHENNGDSFKMLVELAADMASTNPVRNTISSVFEPTSPSSIPSPSTSSSTSSSSSSVPSASPPLEEPLN